MKRKGLSESCEGPLDEALLLLFVDTRAPGRGTCTFGPRDEVDGFRVQVLAMLDRVHPAPQRILHGVDVLGVGGDNLLGGTDFDGSLAEIEMALLNGSIGYHSAIHFWYVPPPETVDK